jgi:hypothetical protein
MASAYKVLAQIRKYQAKPWTLTPGERVHVYRMKFLGGDGEGVVVGLDQPMRKVPELGPNIYSHEAWFVKLDDGREFSTPIPCIEPQGEVKYGVPAH